MIARAPAGDRFEIGFLQLGGHWPALSFPNHRQIYRSDGSNLRRRSSQEGFVGFEEMICLEFLDVHAYAEIVGDVDDRVASDAWEHAAVLIVGQQPISADGKQIFPGAFGQISVIAEQEGFGKSTSGGILQGQNGIEVLAARLRFGRDGVCVDFLQEERQTSMPATCASAPRYVPQGQARMASSTGHPAG